MNIFVLDKNPKLAARALHDKHLVKMVLETAQILSSVHHRYRTPSAEHVYRKTHHHHPCVLWAGQTVANFSWTCSLFLDLCREYKYRYNKTHKSQEIVGWLCTTPDQLLEDDGWDKTLPALAMPDIYKSNPYLSWDDAVQSYRRYYLEQKCIGVNYVPWWTNRGMPTWLANERERIYG